ncbi:MAG: hypothetical protein MI919_15030, partial [Holophagales bacterium]|nr:hypothetical protein [Holophagales bacterium]
MNAPRAASVGDAGAVLRFLGVDGTNGLPLPPLSVAEARRQARRLLRRPKPLRYGLASGDLAEAGWAWISTEELAGEARRALEPLLRHRRAQAGELYRELTYVPGEGTVEFRSRLRSPFGRVEPRELPWYLLLVGDPRDLPHGFELELAVPHAVGRLAFRGEGWLDHLAAYASRVVEHETRPVRRRGGRRVALFAPRHRDDAP